MTLPVGGEIEVREVNGEIKLSLFFIGAFLMLCIE